MDRDAQNRFGPHSNIPQGEVTRVKAANSPDIKKSMTECFGRNNSGTDSSDASPPESASAGVSKGTKRPFDCSQTASAAGGVLGAERDDDELSIPRASLNKMIKELAPNVRVANDARELILSCCTEFIHLISSEANDLCNKQQKKTISPEHVLGGMNMIPYEPIEQYQFIN